MLKGISPLVAVIMLIAFTLIIAGIIAGFVTQFAQSQQEATKYCLDARVLLQRGIWTETTPPNGNLSLTIYNYGKVDLNFEVILRYSNITRHIKGIEIYNQTFNVTHRSPNNVEIALLEDVSDDLQDVTIKSTMCDLPCYECPAAQDFLRYVEIKGLGY